MSPLTHIHTSARRGGAPRRAAGVLAAGVLLTAVVAPTAGAADEGADTSASSRTQGAWIGTWATVPTAVPASGVTTLEDQTVRQVVHTSVAGRRLRIRLTNEFGSEPLRIGEVHVARRDPGSTTDVIGRTDRQVTFSGHRFATIPAGAPMLSDPVRLRVPDRADLVVSIYLPRPTPVTTLNAFSYQENVLADGNVTGAHSVEATSTNTAWYFLSGVSVKNSRPDAASIVALGDSITNGFETDVNENHRWPDRLSNRLQREPELQGLGVLNLGVAGNRLLHDPNPPAGNPAEGYAAFFGQSALRRFNRDVASQPGARYLITLLGVNDLGHPGTSAPESETVSARQLIAAHRQLIARAHSLGMKAYGGTILPFKGDTLGFYSEENGRKWRKLNRWIRTSGEYDAVIDFAKAVRDPEHPRQLLPRYDSGDHLHPNDAGMKAMARAIPLRLFR